MEGVSHEAASLAGTLGLSKLICFWDDNKISIDGNVEPWFNENSADRFKAYGWQVIENIDGHNPDDVAKAINQAKENNTQPTMICCKTIIGFGAPSKQNTAGVHGAPLGSEEIKKSREELNWTHEPFDIPQDLYSAWDCSSKGQESEQKWNELFAKYESEYPDLAKEFLRRMRNELPENWDTMTTDYICSLQAGQSDTATRKSSQNVLSEYGPNLPELLGGSADLTGSNGTMWKGAKTIDPIDPKSSLDFNGEYLHYGVREFGMTAIGNGLALHGGFIPYGGTFMTFLDYSRNAVRMAALMKLRNIFVFTHDSIALGEDGPTHQPIEHLAMLRATPNLECWRPCDSVETAVAWREAISNKNTPSALALTRQTTKSQNRDNSTLNNISKGGYVLLESNKNNSSNIDLVIIATGSEVELATAALNQLSDSTNSTNSPSLDLNIRVVSMPCLDRFKQQDESYKKSVLGDDLSNLSNKLVIEAGCSQPWFEFVNNKNQIISIDSFGESAPASVLFKHFGFTVDNVVETIKRLVRNC